MKNEPFNKLQNHSDQTSMIPNLPLYISLVFLAAVAYTYLITLKASHNHKVVRWGSLLWLIVIAVPALYGFFLATSTMPPRMPILLAPPLIAILIAFNTQKGKAFTDSLDIKLLTWLSLIRIPIEICLFWLFLAGHVPEVMTFEGRNWDILAGVTVPVVAYLYFNRKTLSKKLFLAWNVIGILLLVNSIVYAILAAPSDIQQFGLERPNMAILHFPFVWLASYVAPMVLFSHFVIIRKLIRGNS
jgi:hypothetical protein